MRIKHSAVILTAGFILMPTFTWSQFPAGGPGGMGPGGFPGGGPGGGGGFPGGGGPGGGGPGGGGMGRGQFDPDSMFNWFSGGKDSFQVADLQGMQKTAFERMGPRFGLTGPEVTRDQLKVAMEKLRQGGQGMGGGPGGMGRGPAVPGAVPGNGADSFLDERFKQMDRNGNGVLEFDEMSETLQSERDKYDTNKDGFIDLAEFKAYAAARFPPMQGGGAGGFPGMPGFPGGPPQPGAPTETPKPEEEKRPIVYRAGKLPKDLPTWFTTLDTDKDGQIGLYEWKNETRKFSDFMAMDLNKDGFVTVDEYYRWKKTNDAELAKAGGGGSMAPSFGGPMGGGGMGRGGFGGGPPGAGGFPGGGPPGGGFGGGGGGRGPRGNGEAPAGGQGGRQRRN